MLSHYFAVMIQGGGGGQRAKAPPPPPPQRICIRPKNLFKFSTALKSCIHT